MIILYKRVERRENSDITNNSNEYIVNGQSSSSGYNM